MHTSICIIGPLLVVAALLASTEAQAPVGHSLYTKSCFARVAGISASVERLVGAGARHRALCNSWA